MARFQISRILDFGPIRHGLSIIYIHISSLGVGNEWTDVERDGRIHPTRPSFEVRTGTGEINVFFVLT